MKEGLRDAWAERVEAGQESKTGKFVNFLFND